MRRYTFLFEMSLRMVLKSSDGTKLFENNSAYDFTVQLDRQINLNGYWMVALTEVSITYQANTKRIDDVYVFSNVCEECFIGPSEAPLLRMIHIGKEDTEQTVINKKRTLISHQIFENPYYIPVRQGQLNQVHIYIKDDKGKPCSFINEETNVTLHFKKFPFQKC